MAVAKNKVRITITIHKETKELLDSLIPLHKEELSYSNLIEVCVMYYGKAIQHQLDEINDEIKENKNGKN